MDRVTVDPDTWMRLVISAAKLPRTVQASLMTLGLLMSPSGSVRNAVAHLVCLTARSRPTISEHLGTAQADGWLTCLQRGGNRADGATASVYQATVPAEVWHRRQEFLMAFSEEPDQTDLPVLPSGSVIPVQDHRGPTSEFSAQKINQSISQGKTPSSSAQGSAVAPSADPVVAAVIEELAALAGELVSPAWAARCVSQIVRHRRVRHPIAYVVKTLQNAAMDGSLAERFLPSMEARSPGCSSADPLSGSNVLAEPPVPSSDAGEAPWDSASFDQVSPRDGQKGTPAADMSTEGVQVAKAEQIEAGRPSASQQEIYRPGGRVLAGLGKSGAKELVKLRQQFAARQQAKAHGSARPKDPERSLERAA